MRGSRGKIFPGGFQWSYAWGHKIWPVWQVYGIDIYHSAETKVLTTSIEKMARSHSTRIFLLLFKKSLQLYYNLSLGK